MPGYHVMLSILPVNLSAPPTCPGVIMPGYHVMLSILQ